jgi:hypothetical protein
MENWLPLQVQVVVLAKDLYLYGSLDHQENLTCVLVSFGITCCHIVSSLQCILQIFFQLH